MYDPEMRKDCPMRGNLGNCSPVGGFCMDAVSDEICEAVHNAYDYGFHNAVRTLKEQEAVEPSFKQDEKGIFVWCCGSCGAYMYHIYDGIDKAKEYAKFCRQCGKPVLWESR